MPRLKPRQGLLLSLATGLLLLLGIEVAARVASTALGDPAPGEDWYVYSPDLGWVVRPGFRGTIYGAERAYDGRRFSEVDAADLDGARPTILFLGDSITFGFGVPAQATLVEQVDDRLAGAVAINLGVPGYTSCQGSVLATALPLEPDVVVVTFGANDRRYVLSTADADGPAHFQSEYASASGSPLSLHFAAYRWLRGITSSETPGSRKKRRNASPELRRLYASGVRVDELVARVEPSAFRANIVASIRAIRAAGAEPVLLALPDHPLQTRALEEASIAEADGAAGAAEELLREAVARENMFSALARRRLIELLQRTGRAAEVEAWVRVPQPVRSLHGGSFLYSAEHYRAILREVAEQESAILVDAFDPLREAPTAFRDYCHLTEEGNALLAELLVPVLRRLVQPGG